MPLTINRSPILFNHGQMVMTRSVNGLIADGKIDGLKTIGCVGRHVRGDWGDMPPEDKKLNDTAVKDGDRLMSSYTVDGIKLWVITEHDRSVTTILLPEDY